MTSWWRVASPRTSTWRWTTPTRVPRPGRSPVTPERPRPATSSSTSSPRPRPWAPGSSARPEPLVVNYHNVTPPEYYAPWDNGMARHQLLAQTQLRQLAPRAALGLAVSSFNEAELQQAGLPPHRRRAPGRHGARPRRRRALRAARRRATPAGAGSAWDVSPRTRRSSRPSWRCSWPAPTTTPRPRCSWWAGPSCRPTPRRCTASSTNWVCTTPWRSAAGSVMPRWPTPWPTPTCSCWPHATRASGYRSSRR